MIKETINPLPDDPNMITSSEPVSGTTEVQVQTAADIYYNGGPDSGKYLPGTYTVTLTAYYEDGTADGIDTGISVSLEIDIIDPCLTATLTIDNSVFKTNPDLTLLQFVAYATRQIIWTDAIVTSDLSTAHNPCGPYVHRLWDMRTGS